MKKLLTVLLILTMICVSAVALSGCKRHGDVVRYDPSDYTEAIDLENYNQVYFDDFTGELDRTIWGDCRQGTRRDGYWTKNLAYTDGNGNLIIRTEKRGSRWCSDTHTRQIAGYNGSTVTLTYDDCIPFGLIAGDFGAIGNITAHTADRVGYVIEDTFDDLAVSFDTCIDGVEMTDSVVTVGKNDEKGFDEFYFTAAELYSYYSFVHEIKAVVSSLEKSAIIGLDRSYSIRFGSSVPTTVDLHTLAAHLFGYSSASDFTACVQEMASIYADYKESLAQGGAVNAALENGCFRTENGSFIFPVAIGNSSYYALTYIIIGTDGHVSLWVNDLESALRMTNHSAEYYTGTSLENETYCKDILFVTGPEGVYSGAIRTMDFYKHGFGYYEIRCKLPDTPGIWHAFWLMCGDVYSESNGSSDGVEIDVFEYLPARDSVNCALHWDGYDAAHQNAHMRFEKTGFADDEFHTFGVRWDETGYTFYMDGYKVWTSTGDGICSAEGYMIISTEYGEWGDWVGTLDEDFTALDWVIDYVKVYERK